MPRNCGRWDSPARQLEGMPRVSDGALAWSEWWDSCPVFTCRCHGVAVRVRADELNNGRFMLDARSDVPIQQRLGVVLSAEASKRVPA